MHLRESLSNTPLKYKLSLIITIYMEETSVEKCNHHNKISTRKLCSISTF